MHEYPIFLVFRNPVKKSENAIQIGIECVGENTLTLCEQQINNYDNSGIDMDYTFIY